MLGSIAVLSYSCAALAFVAIAIALGTVWRSRQHSGALVAACLLSAAWAAFVVLRFFSPVSFAILVDIAELARDGGWTWFLLRLVSPASEPAATSNRTRLAVTPARAAFVLLYGALAIITLYGYVQPAFRQAEAGGLTMLLGRVGAAVMGLVFVEQLFLNSSSEARWGVKFACIGLGALFAYDFYLYSDALLFRKLNVEIWAARGIINALIVPLIAVSIVRDPQWSARLAVSRRMLFHSATITGSAIYLLTMSAAGYWLRYFGGSWGPIIQAAFLFSVVVLLAVLLVSGSFRAWLKVFISKHFYHYNYDYREEWLRFTRILSEPGPGLEQRAIRALAGLVESPGGILMLRRGAAMVPVAGWNAALPDVREDVDSAFARLLQEKSWVVDLSAHDETASAVLPAWLRKEADAWLVVPLLLQGGLSGFIVLARARSRIKLNWEVLDVLKIAGSQAAGSLAQKQFSDELSVARQFESYNRMSTFVVHDVKNLVSQLSLLVKNADRHRDSPEFQQDMIETVAHAVDRMKLLLQKFSRTANPERPVPVLLEHAATRALASKSMPGMAQPALEILDQELVVSANALRLERVLGHLIQNAMEATPRDGQVRVRVMRDKESNEQRAMFEVSDSGSGMSEEFIRERLFKPFESTKPAGMGIGVFESREYIQEIGGRLEVTSKPGAGTRFRVLLPLLQNDEESVYRHAGKESCEPG